MIRNVIIRLFSCSVYFAGTVYPVRGSQQPWSCGRSSSYPYRYLCFEFKLDGTADAALKQIDEKGYLIPYTLDGRKLVKVGVNFSKETRNIDEYIVVEE